MIDGFLEGGTAFGTDVQRAEYHHIGLIWSDAVAILDLQINHLHNIHAYQSCIALQRSMRGMKDKPMEWDIGRQGRNWTGQEGLAKLERLPGRLELLDGKLCISDAERRDLVAGLLENLGLNAVVQFGRLEDWQQAIAARAKAADSPPAAMAREVPPRHWNCRVIEFPSEEETWLSIHEVYYELGVPVAYATSAADPGWTRDDGPEGGLQRLEKFREALRKPVMKVADFEHGDAKVWLLKGLIQGVKDSGARPDVALLSSWLANWLTQPHPELGGALPVQRLASEDGKRQVATLIEQARRAMPSD